MPVKRDLATGKWKIGSGKPIYTSKENAEKAYRAYLAKKNK